MGRWTKISNAVDSLLAKIKGSILPYVTCDDVLEIFLLWRFCDLRWTACDWSEFDVSTSRAMVRSTIHSVVRQRSTLSEVFTLRWWIILITERLRSSTKDKGHLLLSDGLYDRIYMWGEKSSRILTLTSRERHLLLSDGHLINET